MAQQEASPDHLENYSLHPAKLFLLTPVSLSFPNDLQMLQHTPVFAPRVTKEQSQKGLGQCPELMLKNELKTL